MNMVWPLFYDAEEENYFRGSFLDTRKYTCVDVASPKEKGVGEVKEKDLFTLKSDSATEIILLY